VMVAAGLSLLGGAWYYSDALKSEALVPKEEPPEFDLRVAAVESGTIRLDVTGKADRDGDWGRDGVFGVEWEGGYGRAGAILELEAQHVVRTFTAIQGTPRSGDMARLDSFAFPSDPQQAYGLPFEDATVASPLGAFPAWFIAGRGDTWAIFVHGKGADQREALRVLRTVRLPSLVITYRNDAGAPGDSEGLYRYGETEWEDLEAAVEYALGHGARKLVLVGYSMGGGIVASFLYRSLLAGQVSAAVLDSPMLDFEATVAWGSRDRFAPGLLKAAGRQLAAWRFGVNWGELDYLSRAGELSVPILLFHGDDDPKVPVRTSDQLAEARPDLVTYVRVPGAGHVRSWNSNAEAYERAMEETVLGHRHYRRASSTELLSSSLVFGESVESSRPSYPGLS